MCRSTVSGRSVRCSPGWPRRWACRPVCPRSTFPACRSACVVLLDGLGLELLADAGADAPFLSGLLDGTGLLAGCPTTTATSMGSFGTGLTPGVHGLLGYEVLDPDRGVLLNELKWDAGTDPLRWQPYPTVFGTLAAAGVAVTRIGNPEFRDSGLTAAALRGGELHRRQTSARPGRRRGRGAGRPPPGAGLRVLGGRGRRGPRARLALTGVAARPAACDRELGRLARRLPPGHAAGGDRRSRHGGRAAPGPGRPGRGAGAGPRSAGARR